MHVRRYREAYETMPSELYAAIMRLHISTTMITPMDEQTFDGYFRPWRDREGQAAYCRFLGQLDDGYLDELEGRLGAFDGPIRILWGEDDTWIPLDQAHRLLVPRTGHFVMDDAPDAVLENVKQS